MVLAQDASCYIDWIQPDLLAFMPNWNYLHISRDVLPALLERGVTQEQIDQTLDWVTSVFRERYRTDPPPLPSRFTRREFGFLWNGKKFFLGLMEAEGAPK